MALVALVALWSLGPQFIRRCMVLVQHGMRFDHAAATDDDRIGRALTAMSSDVMSALTPLLGLLLVAALAGPLLLSGWNFTVTALLRDF